MGLRSDDGGGGKIGLLCSVECGYRDGGDSSVYLYRVWRLQTKLALKLQCEIALETFEIQSTHCNIQSLIILRPNRS